MNAYGWLAKMFSGSLKPLFQIRPKLHAACIRLRYVILLLS